MLLLTTRIGSNSSTLTDAHQHQSTATERRINDESFNTRSSVDENPSMRLNQSSVMISDSRSQEIYDLVKNKFSETGNRFAIHGHSLLRGDRGQNFSILSRTMMQAYIDNFWRNFHPQLPICE